MQSAPMNSIPNPGFRSTNGGTPPPPNTGIPYRPPATPPPQQQPAGGSPMMRPGFRPSYTDSSYAHTRGHPQTQQPPVSPHPLPGVRPASQQGVRTFMPSTQPGTVVNTVPGVPRPIAGQTPPGPVVPSVPNTPPTGVNSPTTSTISSGGPQSPVVDQSMHNKARKRMYPEQIANAYLDTAPSPLSGHGYSQQQTGASSPMPSMTPPQYTTPQDRGYHAGGLNTMTNQFGAMNINGLKAPELNQSVPLIGAPPVISDLYAPPPQINLPPNSTVTDSPFANSDPSFKCCTLNAIPVNGSLLKKSRLPLALVLAPYRTSDGENDKVPVIRDSVIARCRRCRAYINPFVTFVEGGQRWKCNLCFLLNDVPAAFDYDPQTQQPADRWKRAELNYACVEFVAPTEYMVRPPQAPAYVFVIDVSYSAVQSGMVAAAARAILESLERIPNRENRTKIALITVDSALHFYNLNPALSDAQMQVVSDIEDVFLPQPAHLLADLSSRKELVKSLLQKLPDMFKDTTNVNNALGSALQAAFQIVSPYGGKIVCLQSTLPNVGIGALKNREDPKARGTAKETPLLNAASSFYKSFAVDCSRSQVACDMLIFGGQYADVATLGCLPRYTGGQTYFYPGYHNSRPEDSSKFAHEFSELLAEEIGLEAVLRIRASRNLRMSAFHGNFFIRSSDLLALPNVPRNQSYCVEVSIEDEVRLPTACFQTALLHTTCFGERRIRVITLCLPVTDSLSELYASANQVAIAAYLANKGIERGLTSKLEDARDAIVNKTIDILGVYKSQVLGFEKASSPQLSVPSNLKLLPLLALSLVKNDALRFTSQLSTDSRSNAINLLRTMPIQLLIPFLYPNLYALHTMPMEVQDVSEDNVVFPQPLNLTLERLEMHGCYLLENGQDIFIWVGRGVVPQLCVDLFGVNSYEALRGGKYTLPILDTPINKKTNAMIGSIRKKRRGNYYPVVYLVKEDSEPALRLQFMMFMIEDRTDSVISYQQFLQHLKDKVNSGSF